MHMLVNHGFWSCKGPPVLPLLSKSFIGGSSDGDAPADADDAWCAGDDADIGAPSSSSSSGGGAAAAVGHVRVLVVRPEKWLGRRESQIKFEGNRKIPKLGPSLSASVCWMNAVFSFKLRNGKDKHKQNVFVRKRSRSCHILKQLKLLMCARENISLFPHWTKHFPFSPARQTFKFNQMSGKSLVVAPALLRHRHRHNSQGRGGIQQKKWKAPPSFVFPFFNFSFPPLSPAPRVTGFFLLLCVEKGGSDIRDGLSWTEPGRGVLLSHTIAVLNSSYYCVQGGRPCFDCFFFQEKESCYFWVRNY